MKRNKWLLSLSIGLLCCGSAYAQTTVKGKITSESGEPLIGATIAVKNSTDGTVTDIDGNYSLKTKKTLNSKDLLLFSYVGYKTLQKNYTGNTMNVKLAEESQQLNDVVVTALGIKRGEKGLGYATETVKGDKITSALPSNWSTALNGKVAGLSVISSGGPLNSSRISLRGDVSLNQNGNDALVVVDGVPMSSPMTNPGVAYGAGSNSELSVDYGNGFSDAQKGSNDIGNSYVEIDLTNQHLYLFKDGDIVLETDFVSGNMSKADCVTPPGVFGLTYKTRNAILRGTNYETPVNYWMPFNGNVGMHDATWRRAFGGTIYLTSGSHGCINLPLHMAASIYEYVSTGFPVVCYYY